MGSAIRSALEKHQLRSDPGGNDTLQAEADNNQCTWAYGSLCSFYSPICPTNTSSTQLYFKAQLLPQSSGLLCAAA